MIIAVENSKNQKTGDVSSTYAPILTCPTTCPFLDSGCYAQHGRTAMHLRRINQASEGMSQEALAREEAECILRLSGKRPLRLHVVGDCTSDFTTDIVADACEVYSSRHGSPVWTYTHAWRTVARSSWRKVSVIASCETAGDILDAHERGYACCVAGAGLLVDGFRLIRCPAETKVVDCQICRLCMHADRLLRQNRVILFTPHGAGKDKVKGKLEQLRR